MYVQIVWRDLWPIDQCCANVQTCVCERKRTRIVGTHRKHGLVFRYKHKYHPGTRSLCAPLSEHLYPDALVRC